ncbi:MAG: hypothetical protein HYV09_14545 [Deltaproteobacteria bacterium]|nr:hypothetical protein [Deltaproteobacteria bacterium]
MPSKLEQFLSSKKIDRRQLLVVSKDLEQLRPEDRKLKLAKRQSKGEGNEGKAKPTGKPRSGRPLSEVTLNKILAGKDVSGPSKTRVLRAVNTILERKKQDKVQIADLFDLAKKAE